MALYPEDAPVPHELVTDEFIVRPLGPEHAEADFEALTEALPYYRKWQPQDWNHADFDLEENRAEMAQHRKEHDERVAFTFTILDPTETRVLGCVYVGALSPFLTRNGVQDVDDVAEHSAQVYLWVRPSLFATNLDQKVIQALAKWFRADWSFGLVAFYTDEGDERSILAMTEAGLSLRWRACRAGRTVAYVVYA